MSPYVSPSNSSHICPTISSRQRRTREPRGTTQCRRVKMAMLCSDEYVPDLFLPAGRLVVFVPILLTILHCKLVACQCPTRMKFSDRKQLPDSLACLTTQAGLRRLLLFPSTAGTYVAARGSTRAGHYGSLRSGKSATSLRLRLLSCTVPNLEVLHDKGGDEDVILSCSRL